MNGSDGGGATNVARCLYHGRAQIFRAAWVLVCSVVHRPRLPTMSFTIPEKKWCNRNEKRRFIFQYLVQDLSTYIWFYIKALWGVCVVNHEDLLWVVRAASGLLSGAEICTHGWVELLPLCWLRSPGLMSDVEAEHTVYPAVIKKHLLIPGCVPPYNGWKSTHHLYFESFSWKKDIPLQNGNLVMKYRSSVARIVLMPPHFA